MALELDLLWRQSEDVGLGLVFEAKAHLSGTLQLYAFVPYFLWNIHRPKSDRFLLIPVFCFWSFPAGRGLFLTASTLLWLGLSSTDATAVSL